MIKFHCVHCNHKLGVPDEWAGKRIRCSRCKETSLVPYPQIELQSSSGLAPTKTSLETDQTERLEEAQESLPERSDLPTASNPSTKDRQTRAMLKREVPGSAPPCPHPHQDTGRPGQPIRQIRGFLWALGLGLLFSLTAGAIWTGLSWITRFEWSFLLAMVGWLAGLGIRLGSRNSGAVLGFTAVIVAMGAMISAKTMKAHLIYVPAAQISLQEEIAYWTRLENGLTEKELNAIVSRLKASKTSRVWLQERELLQMALSCDRNERIKKTRRENTLVFIACRNFLESTGEVPAGKFLQLPEDPASIPDPNLRRMNIMLADKIQRVISLSTESQLRQILTDHLPIGARRIADQLRSQPVGIRTVFRQAFSCSDILWFPLGWVAACYSATKRIDN